MSIQDPSGVAMTSMLADAFSFLKGCVSSVKVNIIPADCPFVKSFSWLRMAKQQPQRNFFLSNGLNSGKAFY
jgi:hypothetical protein